MNTIEKENFITYRGVVTIQQLDKNGKVKKTIVKNSGTPYLFCSMLRSLAGVNNSMLIPSGIQLYKKETNGNYKMLLVQPVGLSRNPILSTKEGTKWSTSSKNIDKASRLTYSFLVPGQDLLSSGENKVDLICLINRNFTNPQIISTVDMQGIDAYVEYKSEGATDNRPTIDARTNTIIYWDLYLDTAKEST